MELQYRPGLQPLCWILVLVANRIVSSQLQTQGTTAPSFKPQWQTPSSGWSQFSNKVPWTTKVGSPSLTRKTSSQQNTRGDLSQTTETSNPPKPGLTSTGTWGQPPQSNTLGTPAHPRQTAPPVSAGIPVQPSQTDLGIPVQPSQTALVLPIHPNKTAVPVSQGTPAQPSRTAVPNSAGTPVQPRNSSIPVSLGIPVQPSRTVMTESVGIPVQPSRTALRKAFGTPTQPGKTVVPQSKGTQGISFQPNQTEGPVSQGLPVQPSDNTIPGSSEGFLTGLSGSPVKNTLRNLPPTHSTWNSRHQNQTSGQLRSQSVDPSIQPQVWRTDSQSVDTQTAVQSDPQLTDARTIETWTGDQQRTGAQEGHNSSSTDDLNAIFAKMFTTFKPIQRNEGGDVAGSLSSASTKNDSFDSSSMDGVAPTANTYDDSANVFSGAGTEAQSADEGDPAWQYGGQLNTSSESTGQLPERYQSIDTHANGTAGEFNHEYGSDHPQPVSDGIYGDAEYDDNLVPFYDSDYIADEADMNQNGSELSRSVETEQGTLLITKIEDLHDSDLESDLVYKVVELSNGNSTEGESGSLNQVGNENTTTVDNANVWANGRLNTSNGLGQFHVPDDDCLYDVYGTSGSLKFPDVENFPISSDKEFVTCRLRVRVPDGPNIKVSVDRLALSLGVEQMEIAVGMDGELRRRVFTGSKVPRDLVVKGSRLWLTARVRNDNYDDKIVLSFAETAEDAVFPTTKNYSCGAILTDMSGNITSPGYPERGHYDNNQECLWYIVAPSQSVIRLTVHHFSTDIYDHVTMGIGLHAGATNSKLLTLYGHLQEERETVIPANSLWVHFVSDDSDTDAGFFISYTVLPRVICNSSNVLTEEEGLITSVGYPQLYPINSECSWFIRAPPESYVNITFFDLFVEDGRDFVLIGEGTEIFGGPFMTFTGNSTGVNPVRLDSSNVWVHFTSDHLSGDLPYRGFSLSYQVHFYEGKEIPTVAEDDAVTTTATEMTTSMTTTMTTTKTKTTTGTSSRPNDEDNMVLKDIPMNDQGKGQVITIPLTGVKEEQLDRNTEKFRAEMARLLNELCTKELQDECTPKHKLTAEDISLLGARSEQGRLLVEVRVEADVTWPAHAMAATDYEELERLFHSDLQSLDLQDEDAVDKVSSHLPEWLIGVIVVVILLIIAFFAMIIYSLMKERKKNRAGSYGGTTSTGSVCEDLEVGKTDGNIRITAFSLEQGGKDTEGANGQAGDGANGAAWTLDSEVASTLQRRQHGVSGCMNPAFIDDDAEKDEENNGEKKEDKKEAKPNGKAGCGEKSGDKSGGKSSKSGKNNAGGEELEMNGKVKGPGQENGSAVKQLNNLSKDTETTDEETAIDEAEDGERAECQTEGGGVKDRKEAGPEPSTSGGGPRQLEVVVDRDPSPSDPHGCVMVHMDKDSKQGDSGNEQESSTDEKDDGIGMSTNL